MLDTPDVGVIVLYPIAKIQGLTASATSGQAPKDARKAYEKGLKAVKKDKPDQAEQEFRKAVQVYPRYAEAWYELGKALERREHYPEAREAYASALAADSKYVYPYQQLYQMALREQNWKDLADKTDQLLHLDPYEFPAAYYFNALAHLELKEYDAAEKSAQQAVEADWKQAESEDPLPAGRDSDPEAGLDRGRGKLPGVLEGRAGRDRQSAGGKNSGPARSADQPCAAGFHGFRRATITGTICFSRRAIIKVPPKIARTLPWTKKNARVPWVRPWARSRSSSAKAP